MLEALRKRFNRWLAVDRYEKDKDIRNALEWMLDRVSYRALLRVFAEDGLDAASGISAEERRALLACLSRADRGEKVTADALPRFADRSGRLKIGSWLTNAGRRDLGLMPREAREVVPISCYCDDNSGRVVAATYGALGYSDAEQLGQLRQVAVQAKLRTWAEILPFVVGPCFASCGSSLSFSDCLLLPPTGLSFFYDPSLGAFHLPGLDTVVVRVAAARAIGSHLQRFAIGRPLPAADVVNRVQAATWKWEAHSSASAPPRM
jgi:hypothetical protein